MLGLLQVPLDYYRDSVGPLGRTVTDVALVFQALPGADDLDGLTGLIDDFNVTVGNNYTQYLNADALKVRAARAAHFRRFSVLRVGSGCVLSRGPLGRESEKKQSLSAVPVSCKVTRVETCCTHLQGLQICFHHLFPALHHDGHSCLLPKFQPPTQSFWT